MRRPPLVLVLVLVALACGCKRPPEDTGTGDGTEDLTANVFVDFAENRSVTSMAGFLNGPHADTDEEVVRALNPRVLRGDPSRVLVDPRIESWEDRWEAADLDLYHELGTRRIFALDATWGHPEAGRGAGFFFDDGTPKWLCNWCGPDDPNGPPWDESHAGGFAKWRDHVHLTVDELSDVITAYNAEHADDPIDLTEEFVFDVWNEPNNDLFWESNRYDEYYETYCVAENAIRELLPDAVVTGPSFASYYEDQIVGLLDYCVGEVDPGYSPQTDCSACRVDMLNWHTNLEDLTGEEFDPSDPPYRFEDVIASVATARGWMSDPSYASLGLSELMFLEHTGMDDHHRPGEAVRYFQTFEDAGIDGAARSCWSWDDPAISECFDASIGGLYNGPSDDPGSPETWEPRPIAWVYTAYAAGVDGRVDGTTNDARLAVLATRQGSDGLAEILVGHARGGGTDLSEPIDVVIEVFGGDASPALAGVEQVVVDVLYLPHECAEGADPFPCGLDSLTDPEVTTSTVELEGGWGIFATRALGPHEAMIVRMGAAD